MMRVAATSVPLAVLTSWLAVSPLWAAPKPTPKGPFRLSFTLDRNAYYEREPILLDASLTNSSGRLIYLPPYAYGAQLGFRCWHEKDNAHPLAPHSVGLANRLLLPLGDREAVRFRFDL